MRKYVAESTLNVPDYNLIGAVMFHFHRDLLTWQGY